MKEKIHQKIKKFFLIDDTPHKIAGGAALGIFLGIIPGEGILSTLLFSYVFRLNRLAALAGVAITNMWTTIVILPLAAVLGGFLFHENPSTLINNFNQSYHLGFEPLISYALIFKIVLPLVTGFFIIAAGIAVGFYFFLFYLLKYQKIRFK